MSLISTLKKIPIIGNAIQAQHQLRVMLEQMDKKISQMPRSSTCAHSEVPNGRTFCNYFQRCCISYCERCENFKNKYLTAA